MARPKKNTNTQALADKMRKAVLQAAIEGKLTKQNPIDDGDARDLLAQVETEKQRLFEAGEIKREKSLPDITEEEKPFDIPDNWEWARLGDIGSWGSGSTPSRSESKYYSQGTIPWLKTGDLNDGLISETSEKITKLALEKTSVSLQPVGAVLIAMYGATIGKLGLLEIESTTNQACCGCTLFEPVYNYYLFYFLLANRQNFIDMGAGGAQPNISKAKIINTLIPLPPLAEQRRIVVKLKAALAEIDSLHADETTLHALQTAFPSQMQASLLQSAIEGKLTQQDPTKDGNASDLLTEIQAEKQRLVKAGELKRQKTLSPIIEEEKPFDIPDNWVWVRLGNLTYNRGQKNPDKSFSYIDIASIDNKTQILNSKLDIISPSEAPSRARKIVNKGDIIYSTVRPYLMNIAIIDKDIEPEPIASTGFAVLTTPYDLTNKYLFRVLMSPHFDRYANHSDNSKGVAYPAINDTRLMNGLIPLPPLAEQQRIVDLLEQALPEVQTLKEIHQ